MAGQQGQSKYGFGWPDGRLGGLGPPGSTTPATPSKTKFDDNCFIYIERIVKYFQTWMKNGIMRYV